MEKQIYIDGSVKCSDTENKYIFWDIDGTLAPYRFNGHVGDSEGTNNGMSSKEIEEHVFLFRTPSIHMQKVITTCKSKENIVMGHCQVLREMQDKQLWLNRYFPTIKERILVYEDISKADSILKYCEEHRIDLKEVIYVDDVLRFLREAERKGIKSYHISSFLDWEFQDGFMYSHLCTDYDYFV